MSENNPLKSDYEPVIWSNNGVDGKVRIIDPNPLAQIVPHEDLFIYVSLKANQRSKTLLTQSDNNGGIKIENFIRNTIDLTVPQQTTEMIDGSKLFSNVAALSTEWTEIGGSPFKENDLGKDFEGFGITNIDIEVKSQTNPKVIIDFIDVRGATLMEQGSCSPYGLFFNLPYPVFTLTLKGYYGRPATYYLNLVKFNSKFNSDTGNIECRGEFIGWTFGFLSDVMVSYASAAQYLNEGLYRPQAILKQKYEDTWNYYIDSGFIPEGTPQPYCSVQNPDGTTRCKTIKDLLTDNYILQHTTLPDVKGSTEFIELDNILKLEQNCLQYQEKLNDLEKELGNLLKDQTTSSNPNYTSKFKIPNLKSSDVIKTPNQTAGTEGNKFSKTNNNTVNSVKELLNRYFDKKGGFLTNNIIIIKNLQITEGVKGFEFISGYNNALLTSANAEELNADGGSTKYIYDILNKDSYVKKFQNGFLDDFGYLGGGTSDDSDFWIDLGVLKEGIDNDLKTVRAEIDIRREKTIGVINEKIRTVIGFDPTIRNIFTVILCNSDTFMEILKEVSVKAEDYHDKNKITDGSILSGPNNKIFAWPTYMQSKTIGGKQSTARKEVYPGVTYPQWPEVKFVEDFINAFLDFKKDIDLLNDDKQGKPGFDDYAPINPLETPLNRDDYFLIYKDIQNNAEIGNGTGFYRAIGERLFVALDHSYLQPLRSDGITKFIPETTIEGLPNTPLNDADRTEFIQSLGSIDAWNLVNTIENPDLGYSIINGSISSEDFINKVTEQLNQVGVLTKVNEQTGNLLSRNESYGLFALNQLKGDYFMYKPNEKEGCGHCIKLNGSGILGGDPIFIHPNPHKMDVSNLIQFRDGNEQPRAIELTIEDFKTKVKSYTGILQKTIPSTYDADEWEFAGDLQQINEVTLDEETKQQTPKYASNRLLFTLDLLNVAGGWLDNGNNISSWFKNDNTTEIPTNVMGSYMIHDYWSDDESDGTGDDTAWIFLNTPYETNGEFIPVLENDDKENPNIRLSILPITTTPLWLDNVNNFRKESYKTISGGNDLKTFGLKRSNGVAYNTKDIEARNLAYLFLQTLKPTPLIIRLTDDDTEMQENTSFTKQYSVKLFNSGAGIVKVPKAWVYNMGAILWRWKCFVANPSTNEWTNPIKKQKPLGYDPLSQPGFGGTTERDEHQYSGEDSSQEYNRSRIDDYLKHVYGNPPSGSNWGSRVQESVFNKQNFDVYNCVAFDSSQNQIGAEGWGFDYYNIYQAGSFTNRVTTNTQQPTGINTETVKKWTENYGWPQAWISPHHIPYTHPVCLDDTRGDEDESDFTWFTVISSNASAYNDYHSIQNYAFGVDGEFTLDGVSSVSRDFELNTGGRSVEHDGALGHVLQNLPDQVKDEFIRIFEEWVDNEWKDELLPIVDPANFGTPTNTMTQVYQTYKDVPIEGSSTLFGFKDEGAPKETLKKKLLVDTFSIINSTPKIWWGVDYDSFRQGTNVPSGAPGFIDDNFIVKEDDYRIYLNAFYEEFKIALEKRIKKLQEDESKENEAVGETLLEDDDVKLSLYRTFKSMADKWFSTDPSGKLFFNVTEGANSTYCNKSSGVETVGKNGKSTLATHFQYVSRTMVDIGNDAVIDITKLNELKDNLKISLYQYLSDVLTENNYLFFPLPSYINFGTNGMKTEDLLDMFRPTMSMKDVSCGPLFLSMYVGGNSRVLNINNFGAKVNCPIDFNALSDDGFDLSTGRNTPDEFKQPAPSDPGVTAFRIVYGLENQNHFKNIQLDQSEFSETSESLLVIDKLAQQGGSDQASKGQNLHNVYLTRSYTCQVESFGNVMIQPMTYFDLFGVPMFNGTYLITEVRHNFKPNHATTTFKGVRQPIATVPIVTEAALAMNLSLKDVKASENRKSIKDASTGSRTSNGTTKTGGRTSNGTTKTGGGSGDYAPVLSAYDGVVMVTGAAGGYGAPPNGGWIIVRYGLNGGDSPFSDGNYYYYVYGHCNAAEGIVKNTKVKKGQVIGSAVFPNYDINGNKEFNGGLHLHLIVVKTKDSKWAGGGGRDYIAKIDPQLVLNLGADKSIKGVNDFPASADKYKSAKNPNGDTSISPDGYNLRPSIAPELKDFGNPVSSENLPRISSYMYRKDPVKGTYYHGGLDIGFTSPTKGSGVEGSDNAQDDSLASSNQRCKTSYPKLPWTEHKRTLLTYRDAKKYLSKATDEATAKSVFAILWAEACHTSNKNCGATPEEKATPAFISSGNYNYAGVQSDGNWGDKERTGTENRYPFFSSQYCRKDSGNQYRAFASFENNEKFLDFMIDRIKAKGFNSSTPDGWTTTYVQKWWSPGLEDKNGGVAAKTKIYKDSTKTWVDFHDTVKIGGETYDNKKSIFNTAINRWDNLT